MKLFFSDLLFISQRAVKAQIIGEILNKMLPSSEKNSFLSKLVYRINCLIFTYFIFDLFSLLFIAQKAVKAQIIVNILEKMLPSSERRKKKSDPDNIFSRRLLLSGLLQLSER